jgi:hypothetical protein
VTVPPAVPSAWQLAVLVKACSKQLAARAAVSQARLPWTMALPSAHVSHERRHTNSCTRRARIRGGIACLSNSTLIGLLFAAKIAHIWTSQHEFYPAIGEPRLNFIQQSHERTGDEGSGARASDRCSLGEIEALGKKKAECLLACRPRSLQLSEWRGSGFYTHRTAVGGAAWSFRNLLARAF